MRVAVELLMDTGRRPDEICQAAAGMPGPDERGPVLIYTDFKTNRCDRRLPISTATAERDPGNSSGCANAFRSPTRRNLCCCPGPTGNPNGQRTIRAATLTNVHREWVDHLQTPCLDDGTAFPGLGVPYAYRHSYANAMPTPAPPWTCCGI